MQTTNELIKQSVNDEKQIKHLGVIIKELLNQLNGIEYGEIGLTLKIHNSEIMSVDTSRKVNLRTLFNGDNRK